MSDFKLATDQKPKELSDKQVIKLLNREVETLLEALQFYADPVTYFATRVIVDSPGGGFHNDFNKLAEGDYERFGWEDYRGGAGYFGKTARKAILKNWKRWEKATS